MREDDEYYVYEWIRLDTNEPFYVGKGKGKRWKILNREYNTYFNSIVNKYPVAVNILHDNLDEETAYGLEVWYIREYRDIIGYDLVNFTEGGEGNAFIGENHPMYGKNHSEETKQKISEARKERYYGENHPMYGKHHSEETKKKMSENHADFSGKNHPRHGLHWGNEFKRKVGKSVICLTTKKIFFTLTNASEYYNCNINCIVRCCKGKQKYAGKLPNGIKLVWKYIVWNHDKKFRIKGRGNNE